MNSAISMIDLIALGWFVSCWTGYLLYTCNTRSQRISLRTMMDHWREAWALSLLKRDNRIMDSQVINALVRKETFFASTTILILASSIALMGLRDKANHLLEDIPYIQPVSATVWEIKVTVLIMIFVYAFFKFSWSIRQHSYSAILLGSIPEPGCSDQDFASQQAMRLAGLSNLGARNFNDGIRAYYFALAELSWFISPLMFMVFTVWVVLVLYRREYHSKTLGLLASDQSLDAYK